MMEAHDPILSDEWAIIGPFGNTLSGGWDKPFPPEWEIDLYREYEGGHGSIRWHFLYSDDAGAISLCGPCWPEVSQIPTPPLKEYEVGYLFTNILSEPPEEKQVVVSSPFRYKMWINGDLVVHSYSVDKAERAIPVHLKSGITPVLIKLEKLLWWEWKMTIKVLAGSPSGGKVQALRALVGQDP